jgi:hypothetical protein
VRNPAIVCLAVWLVPAAAGAALIGVDARNAVNEYGLASGGVYDSYRETITGLGHTIVPLRAFEPQDLAGLRAVVLMQAFLSDSRQPNYSDVEIDAIHSFVAGGGGMVLHGECGYSTANSVGNLNALAAPYGVTFGGLELAMGGDTIVGFVDHPVTAGVNSVGVDFQRQMVSIAPPAADLTTGTFASDFLAAVNGTGGAGNVVLLGDSSLFADAGSGSDRPITFGDNRRLAENIIRFVTVPEPAAALFLVPGATLARRRRRDSHRR